jgi:hypothetical protein
MADLILGTNGLEIDLTVKNTGNVDEAMSVIAKVTRPAGGAVSAGTQTVTLAPGQQANMTFTELTASAIVALHNAGNFPTGVYGLEAVIWINGAPNAVLTTANAFTVVEPILIITSEILVLTATVI